MRYVPSPFEPVWAGATVNHDAEVDVPVTLIVPPPALPTETSFTVPTSPKFTLDGETPNCGATGGGVVAAARTAFAALMSPTPSASGPAAPMSSVNAPLASRLSKFAGVSDGLTLFMSAATPATCGVAIDVPCSSSNDE